MRDPIGTIGVTATQDSDVTLATKGGPKFMARLQQLADATDRHDQALARLNVGKDIETSLNEAKAKLADAEAARNQAAKTLADAKAKATVQIAEADQTLAKANQTVIDANALQSEADKRLKQVAAREAAAEAAIAKAQRAETDANRVRNELQGKIDLLRNRVREIAAA